MAAFAPLAQGDFGLSSADSQREDLGLVATTVYGWSGCGRPLLVTSLGRGRPRALLVFEIHGYEDRYARDGQVLTAAARKVIDHFAAHPEDLGGWSLSVVAAANPDGLTRGWTANGPGRCQVSAGIDVNRDFPTGFVRCRDPRYLTGPRPLASPEARALKDLVLGVGPDVVVDFHGWLATSLGDPTLCSVFGAELGVGYGGGALPGGSFAAWVAGRGYPVALVECQFGPDNANLILRALERALAEGGPPGR